MAPRRGGTAAAAFWRFSLDFYARPGVAAALIALQDEAGADVNLVLYGLWCGLSGRGRLDAAALAEADLATAELRAEIVLPLRGVRRRLGAVAEADIRRLYENAKRIELAAERVVQYRLAEHARPPAAAADASICSADALANLALCLGTKASGRQAALVLRRALSVYAASG